MMWNLNRVDAETKARKIARDRKWDRAAKARRDMTPDDIAAEEQALKEQAAIMAKAMGLDDKHIGTRWDRPDSLDLSADGIFTEYAAGVGQEVAQ